jgi:phosphate starvation-inducible protein PhoH
MNQKNKIYFTPTSFLRGVTFDNSIIIVDECQNLSGLYGELGTIITRSGVNSKIIFCGDTKQDDLTSERFKETSGLREFIKVTDKMTEFRSIIFTPDDIVRSDIVKSFIVSREAYEIENYK